METIDFDLRIALEDLSDLVAPRAYETGLEYGCIIDHRVSRTPVIAMTAHAMEEDRDRCLDAGMDDYLAKPIDPQLFIRAVEKWSGLTPKEV